MATTKATTNDAPKEVRLLRVDNAGRPITDQKGKKIYWKGTEAEAKSALSGSNGIFLKRD